MAKINTDDIDSLRERADVVDVISAYTQLKKSGGHTFKGLCPFHTEKTPSFTVDASRGLWYCFGHGEGGNIYHFIQKTENLSFPEAVEWLARKVGVQLRYEQMRPGEQKASGIKLRLFAANKAAADFFHKALMSSPAAGQARTYLESRGFGKEVAERWLLGFAPGANALCKHLLARGFSEKEILTADLGRTSERDGSLYDTFRGRIIFPTWDRNDNVVGFGARALADQQPKYLNTAETPVFSKSRVMFGLNRAKSTIVQTGAALVVEGYTDVIALHEAGISETVATNGVALGETHLAELKRFAPRAVLMFDADEAGAGATERGFDLYHRIGLEVLVAPLPIGRDPADVVREDGPEAVRKVMEAAQPLMEFKLEQTMGKLPLDTPEARARAVPIVAEVLGWHADPIARHEYAFAAARRIGVEPEAIHRALSERRGPGPDVERGTERDRERRLPGHVKVEREALQLLLTHESEIASWAEDVAATDFSSPARRELFEHAQTALASDRSPQDAAQELSPDTLSLMTELMVGADSEGRPSTERIEEVFVRLRVFRIEREIKERRNTLQDINPLVDPQRHDALFTALVALEAERRDLLRRLEGRS
jgi:DNA primase